MAWRTVLMIGLVGLLGFLIVLSRVDWVPQRPAETPPIVQLQERPPDAAPRPVQRVTRPRETGLPPSAVALTPRLQVNDRGQFVGPDGRPFQD